MLKRTLGSFREPQKSVALIPTWKSSQAQLPDQAYETLFREGYGKNEIVFRCVEEWATDIAEAQLRAYRNTPHGPEVVPDHPAVRLFDFPNPWMSGDDFSGGLEMYKRLAGNTFILKVRSMAGLVRELWLLRPDRVRVIPDRDKYIRAYEYRDGTDTFEIPAKDIIHLKTRHPLDDFYGMAPLMAAAGRIDIDNFMKDIIKGFLRNSGVPAGILRVQGQVSEQEKALFRSRFRADFGGDNAGNVMVVNGGKDAAEYTPMAMPLGARGLVIPELDEIDEARIGMIFGVPQSLINSRVGMNSSSYANKKSDREEFTQRQLVPEWQSIASALTQSLLPEFGYLPADEQADFLAFDLATVQALAQDMDAFSARIIKEVQAGLRSVQSGMKALGLLPMADPGDVFQMPSTYITMPAEIYLAGDIQPAPPQLPAGQPTDEGTMPMRMLRDRPQIIVVNAQPGEVRKMIEYDEDDRMISIREVPSVE